MSWIDRNLRKYRKKLRKAKSREEAKYYARIVEYFRILKEWKSLLKLILIFKISILKLVF